MNLPIEEKSHSADAPAAVGAVLHALAKEAASFAATLYVVGFVIVNVHLSRFAQASTDLIEARFLSAGLLFAFLAGAPLIEASLAFMFVKQVGEKAIRTAGGLARKELSILGRLTGLFLLLQILAWAFWSFLVLDRFSIHRDLSAEAWYFALLNGTAIAVVLWAEWGIRKYHKRINLISWLHELPLLFVLILLSLLGTVVSFARVIYPTVPPSYGGGAAPVAWLIPRNQQPWESLILKGRPVAIVDEQAPFLRVLVCDSINQMKPHAVAIALEEVVGISYVADSSTKDPTASGNSLVALDHDLCKEMLIRAGFPMKLQSP